MRGLVLAFDPTTGAGLIAGDDGGRYPIPPGEWRSRGAVGVRVDFEIVDGAARAVFPVPGQAIRGSDALTTSPLTGAVPPRQGAIAYGGVWLALFLGLALAMGSLTAVFNSFIAPIADRAARDGDMDRLFALHLTQAATGLFSGALAGLLWSLRSSVHWTLGGVAAATAAAGVVAFNAVLTAQAPPLHPSLGADFRSWAIIQTVVVGLSSYAAAHLVFLAVARSGFAVRNFWSGGAGLFAGVLAGSIVREVRNAISTDVKSFVPVAFLTSYAMAALVVLALIAAATWRVRDGRVDTA